MPTSTILRLSLTVVETKYCKVKSPIMRVTVSESLTGALANKSKDSGPVAATLVPGNRRSAQERLRCAISKHPYLRLLRLTDRRADLRWLLKVDLPTRPLVRRTSASRTAFSPGKCLVPGCGINFLSKSGHSVGRASVLISLCSLTHSLACAKY